jgi:hypothetical protein
MRYNPLDLYHTPIGRGNGRSITCSGNHGGGGILQFDGEGTGVGFLGGICENIGSGEIGHSDWFGETGYGSYNGGGKWNDVNRWEWNDADGEGAVTGKEMYPMHFHFRRIV